MLDLFQPYLLDAVGVIVGAVLLFLSRQANAKLGLDIEDKHRQALHSAIMTGVRVALKGGHADDAINSAAIDYAEKSVPDAIKALKPSTTVMRDLAESKLVEVLGMTIVEESVH